MRFASLVVALAVVTVLVRVLQQPETAARVDQAFATMDGQGGGIVPVSDEGVRMDHVTPPADTATLKKVLELAGWDNARLAAFGDGTPLSDKQREELLELLRRLRTFDALDISGWARDGDFGAAIASPTDYRGEMSHLSGNAIRIVKHALPLDLAARLELPAYYECEVALANGAGTATVLTSRAPNEWLKFEALDQPCSFDGLFVKTLPSDGSSPNALFVAQGIAWHPVASTPGVSPGDALLGWLGMDVGLFDTIEQRRPLLGREREAFYGLLVATSRIDVNQLFAVAQSNLSSIRESWKAIVEQSANDADPQRQALAREVVARADAGRYSVAPLFNEPATQVGELALLEGLARRAVRVDVGKLPNGQPNETARRFGITHYYEVDIFTDDSQNNPVVFCATKLPAGFPTGDSIREQVRAAGFFFKSWQFESRRASITNADSEAATETRRFAPLLIGPEPVWIPPAAAADSTNTNYVLGGAFVLAIIAIWAIGWRLARSDRRLTEQLQAERYSLPPGESLDSLVVPPVAESADFQRRPN